MSSFHIASSPLLAKQLLLPNGHHTTSDKIVRILVDADRSRPPDIAYVSVFETAGLVFEGLVALDELEAMGSSAWAGRRQAGDGKKGAGTQTVGEFFNQGRR